MTEAIPHNPEIEKYVLGSVLLDGGVMDSIRSTLELEDFHLQKHATIWRAMTTVYDRGTAPAPISVFSELRDNNSDVMLGDLWDLTEGIPKQPNLIPQCNQLKEQATLRRILRLCNSIQSRCLHGKEKPEEIRQALEKGVLDLHEVGPTEKRPVSTRELIERVGIQQLLSPRRERGIRLPWSRLNTVVNGLQPGQMMVVAAYTGRGKTSFGLQIGLHVTKQMKTAVYWTLEMSPEMLFRRAVNQIIGKTIRGAADEAERARQAQAVEWLSDHPIYFDSTSRTIPAFVAGLRQVQAKADVGLVIVDYLQLIRLAGRAESRVREVGENSRSLKLSAMDAEVPFLVLSQFRRPNGNEPATIHSLKESGDIENDADVILLINSGELNGDSEVQVAVHVGKQREGPAGFDIPMVFNPPSQTFHSTEE